MKKILVPVDFSKASKHALQYAEWLAQSIDAKVIALYVYTEEDAELSETSRELFERHLLVRLKRFATLYPNKHEDNIMRLKAPECSTYKGNVVEGILKKSKEEAIDLVIMGTRAKHNLWEHLMGSVSYSLVTQSVCPVLVVPEGTVFQVIKHIAFATEHFLEEGKVVHDLDQIARSLQAKVHPFFINQFPAALSTAKEEIWPTSAAALYPSITMVRSQSVEEGIMDYLTAHRTDILAMYLPQRTSLENIFHISATKKQILSPKIPILVLKDQA